MKKITLFAACLLLAGAALHAQNTSTSTTEIVNSVVQQSQDAADQAKQAYQDQARTGNREISRLERKISAAKKEVDRLKADSDQLTADIKALDKSVKIQKETLKLQKSSKADRELVNLTKASIRDITRERDKAKNDLKKAVKFTARIAGERLKRKPMKPQ